jgi:hypothetical protein
LLTMRNNGSTTYALGDLFGAVFENTAELAYNLAPVTPVSQVFAPAAANDDFVYDVSTLEANRG